MLASSITLVEASGGGSALDALGINGLAFISQLISFIIVLVLLGKFVIPRILQTLDKRQAVIREGIENAEKARQDLADATARAEQLITNASRQAQVIIDRATKNAEQIARQIEEEAHVRAEQINQQQIARIQQEVNRARQELSREVVNLSIEVASKVISRSMNTKDNRRFVEEFVATSDYARNN
ncbi:MAG TPA: F0F1 ATP synthase subunit B [Ktedonobacteraceae bacterium]|nr:F0F1 ATP synthase subunit B [Ktedonobacteraceae bacterium]